jgi:hypothetical protein
MYGHVHVQQHVCLRYVHTTSPGRMHALLLQHQVLFILPPGSKKRRECMYIGNVFQNLLICSDDPNKIMFAAVTKGMGKGKILGVLGVRRMKQICAELDQGGDFKCERIFGTGATGKVCIPHICFMPDNSGMCACRT